MRHHVIHGEVYNGLLVRAGMLISMINLLLLMKRSPRKRRKRTKFMIMVLIMMWHLNSLWLKKNKVEQGEMQKPILMVWWWKNCQWENQMAKELLLELRWSFHAHKTIWMGKFSCLRFWINMFEKIWNVKWRETLSERILVMYFWLIPYWLIPIASAKWFSYLSPFFGYSGKCHVTIHHLISHSVS